MTDVQEFLKNWGGNVKTFLVWLNEHPHKYMRINILWMFASVLSPWRIPMLLLVFGVNCLLLYFNKKYEEQ